VPKGIVKTRHSLQKRSSTERSEKST